MTTNRSDLDDVIGGTAPADLVIRNGDFVNVHTRRITATDVAIAGDRIACVGDVAHAIGESTTVVDATDGFVVPGLIEAHVHAHHSYLNVVAFSKSLLEHGVTAFADGFYGPGIVGGTRAVEYCLREASKTPVTCLFYAPCIAYQQNRELEIPPTPDGVGERDLAEMLEWDACHGLEEPTVDLLDHEPEVYHSLFERALALNKRVIGHAAGLSETELSRYRSLGVSNDHEMVDADDVALRADLGMKQLLRYSSGAPDLPEVVQPLVESTYDASEFGFCTDMLVCYELDEVGSVDENVRRAAAEGLDPVTAIRMATLNNAEILGVSDELGSVVPGKRADVVVVDDLSDFDVRTVVADGEVAYRDGGLAREFEPPEFPDWTLETLAYDAPLERDEFAITVDGDATEATVRTIVVEDGTFVTSEGEATLPVVDGALRPDPDCDVLLAAMVDRHDGGTRIGLGYVEGFGLQAGALGISVNPGRENVVVVGTDESDVAAAANRIFQEQGGAVFCHDGDVVAEVPLRVFGMQSRLPADETIERFDRLIRTAREQGCELTSPVANLEFICPAHIPSLRISDYGLIDVPSGERKPVVKDRW